MTNSPLRHDADSVPSKPWWRHTRWQLAVVVAVLFVGALIGVYDHYKYDLFPKRFGVVREGQIYRSGQISKALVKGVLADHHIKVIIDLQSLAPKDPNQRTEIQAASALGIDLVRFPMSGTGKGSPKALEAALAKLYHAQQAGQPVLVHCAAGSDRTGAVIALWRLLVEQVPPDQVVNEMVSYRWSPRDRHHLLDHLNQHMPEIAAYLVTLGAIEHVPDPLPQLRKPS